MSNYADRKPWDESGISLPASDMDSVTALKHSGLDWKVEKQRMFTSPDGIQVQEVTTNKTVVRTSDQKILGVVGNRYVPLQNIDAFTFMDSLVATGDICYQTAGSFQNGKKIWLLGKVSSAEILPNDDIDHYIMLFNSHDGTSSLRIIFTTTRIICSNTVMLTLSQAKGQGFHGRHTKSLIHKADEASGILGLARDEFKLFNEFARTAAKIKLDPSEWTDFVYQLISDPPEGSSSRSIKSRETIRDDITALFYNGTGQSIPGVAETGWAAYNAVVEYANFHKPARGEHQQENRFISSLFGSSASLIRKATDQIIQLAA